MYPKFQRHQDNNEFVKLFRKKLSELPDEKLLELISMGQFQALGHWCGDVEDHDYDCENCYSGDTEFEMSNTSILGNVWTSAGRELGLDIRKFVPYEDDDAEESSDSD